MSEDFYKDLVEIYDLTAKKDMELGSLYGLVENREFKDVETKKYVDEFLKKCKLRESRENYLALLSRLITLRDEQFVQALKREGDSEDEIRNKRSLAYLWVKNFHIKRHEKFLKEIEEKELLNPFYRALFRGVHEIGLVLSDWQYEWNRYIIDTINPKLKERFGEKVVGYLAENELFDLDEDGGLADRSYSVLVESGDGYRVESYAEFFKDYVQRVCEKIDKTIDVLRGLEDRETKQKENYLDYFGALKRAFAQRDRGMLLTDWRDVDRAWMQVTSPIQVGHPLEYYEDHYRKAVALEWDIRVTNPKNLGATRTLDAIEYMYDTLFDRVGREYLHIKNCTVENLKRVQLYIGRPALFYASEFNGLFSAQVVPNDEQVSKESGKKIFAFSDAVLQMQKAKPFLKIDRVIFGDDFMRRSRELLFKRSEIWHRIYEVSTIGHEFGHILWLDSDSEIVMNSSGVFKNIEEFKATLGGLVAFFMKEESELKEYLLMDIIKRAVGLIAWRETSEVEPYYCEGLMHLRALFDSGVLSFNGKLALHVEDEFYENLKSWYLDTYEELAKHYLQKRDADIFLKRYLFKKDGGYLPRDQEVLSFVEYYWNLYGVMGRDIDESIDRDEWIMI